MPAKPVARDVMAWQMPKIEDEGYDIVLTVHDELITEAEDSPMFGHRHLSELMSTPPLWAPDIPLAAGALKPTGTARIKQHQENTVNKRKTTKKTATPTVVTKLDTFAQKRRAVELAVQALNLALTNSAAHGLSPTLTMEEHHVKAAAGLTGTTRIALVTGINYRSHTRVEIAE